MSPIGGFPAIAYQAHKGGTSCSVVIGVADDFAVTAAGAPSRARYGKTDPCEMAQDMAELLVGNLKERAGR